MPGRTQALRPSLCAWPLGSFFTRGWNSRVSRIRAGGLSASASAEGVLMGTAGWTVHDRQSASFRHRE
eukprot:10657672-Alexandrium_andersonii.AAC.1